MKKLILILTHNNARQIESVLSSLLPSFLSDPLTTILVIDDASVDSTFDLAKSFERSLNSRSFIVLTTPRTQGYGGNLKVGLIYASQNNFDVLVVLHAERLSSPSYLLSALNQLIDHTEIDCVVGVRAHHLSWTQQLFIRSSAAIFNFISGGHLSDWNSGVRIYRTSVLKHIPFELNTNRRHFDTEVYLQLLGKKARIVESIIDTKTASYLTTRTFGHAWNSLKACLRFRLQRVHLFYDIRYQPLLEEHSVYNEKFEFKSPHSAVCQDTSLVPESSKVLDIGCSTGYVARSLKEHRQCHVKAVDLLPPSTPGLSSLDYYQLDLEQNQQQLASLIKNNIFDVVLMLDVIEHLSKPEEFLLMARKSISTPQTTFIFSTANIAFFVVRIMLLFGQFNYGQKGILDITHKRLFSQRTFRNLLEQTGFIITESRYFPFPFRMLGFSPRLSAYLEKINMGLIFLCPGLFAYQIMHKAVPLIEPSLVLKETLNKHKLMDSNKV